MRAQCFLECRRIINAVMNFLLALRAHSSSVKCIHESEIRRKEITSTPRRRDRNSNHRAGGDNDIALFVSISKGGHHSIYSYGSFVEYIALSISQSISGAHCPVRYNRAPGNLASGKGNLPYWYLLHHHRHYLLRAK